MSVVRPLHLMCAALERRAETFVRFGALVASDLLVVDAVAPRYRESDPGVLLGLALAVRAPRAGHIGVDLRLIADRIDDERVRVAEDDDDDLALAIDWPTDPVAWEARVLSSALVGDPEHTDRPFVRQALDDGHTLLMTRRMWREQERLAEGLRALAATCPSLTFAPDAVEACIAELFSEPKGEAAQAVRLALQSRLAVTTGGPGTGKTYSVKRLLALLLILRPPSAPPLRIELAAPTGKAAVRMKEAIEENLTELPIPESVRAALRSLQPRTLHKLLGMRPDGSCRHDRDRPLPADLVVVDEASMVDLVLMRRLVEALAPGARLMLLGDRDQLASVEVGSVLADLVDGAETKRAGPSASILAPNIVRFSTPRRFSDAPTVKEIATLLQRRGVGDVDRAVRLLTGDERMDAEAMPDRIKRLDLQPQADAPDRSHPTPAQLDALAAPYLASDGFIGQLTAKIVADGQRGESLCDPNFHRALLDALNGYRVLAVHRRGPRGVAGLDRAITSRVRSALENAIRLREGLASTSFVRLWSSGGLYLGQPVLVTENTYDVGLMNGDIGIVLPTAKGLAVVFRDYDAGKAPCREVALARLPAHMGAFAMTVHKSQGSQFTRVALVLAGRDSPIQTRELIYTGITRTSSRLDWLGDPDELRQALHRPIQRASGLRELLQRQDRDFDRGRGAAT